MVQVTEAVEAWKDFNVAMAGATAALAGLVIVAASVNISDIIKTSALTARLGAGIATLVLAVVVSALGLVPGFTLTWLGAAVLAATAVAGLLQVDAGRRIVEDRSPQNTGRLFKAVLGFVPVAAYAVGGALLLAGTSGGLGWLAAGSILAIIGGLLVSWVVLVEVLR